MPDPRLPSGNRLFARYAYAPNSLGYCGPEDTAVLHQVATGRKSTLDVTSIAREFSGAWPYQSVLAELAGIDDPLDATVARAYWTGNALTDAVDREEFGRALLGRITPAAGSYWSHLDDDLLAEASPTHGFHVFGVYPWSRMLDLGRPEALHVLDSCRIGWATVKDVGPDRLQVDSRHLEYGAGVLQLGPERTEVVERRIGGESFIDDVDAGDVVALHWGLACDTLSVEEANSLERWTLWQLDAMAPRLWSQHAAADR